MNIFSTIWKKHLHKGENPLKLADDVGPMKGIFKYTPYDPSTGKESKSIETNNLLVNTSKSNIIRLIAQGQSPWKGAMDPTKLQISRMRFGNNSVIASNYQFPNKLHYYNAQELSTRVNIPLTQVGEATPSFAGGLNTQTNIGTSGLSATNFVGTNATPITTAQSGSGTLKKWAIPLCTNSEYPNNILFQNANPPSHGTLVVKFYKSNVLLETLEFGNFTGGIDSTVYTRSRTGILPTRIVTALSPLEVIVSNPVTRSSGIFSPTAGSTGTCLIYDYTSGSIGWKLVLDEYNITSTWKFDKITFAFEIGKFNVINSIVPTIGYNQDLVGIYNVQEAAIANRFQGNQDWYPVINTEYRDSETDFIDDFSVTFGVNMTGIWGNGNTVAASNQNIRYKEAFLFNGYDDLFSAVQLPSSMDKNANQAYFISWTILAPIS